MRGSSAQLDYTAARDGVGLYLQHEIVFTLEARCGIWFWPSDQQR